MGPSSCNCYGRGTFDPKRCDNWRTRDIPLNPSTTGNSLSVYGSITWSDQGYRNRKGHLRFRLIRDGKVIAEQMHGPAPHSSETLQLDFTDMCEKWQRGDKLELGFHVGDTDHRLRINDLSLYVEVK